MFVVPGTRAVRRHSCRIYPQRRTKRDLSSGFQRRRIRGIRIPTPVSVNNHDKSLKCASYLRSWIANNAESITPLLARVCQNGISPEVEIVCQAKPMSPDTGDVRRPVDTASTTAVYTQPDQRPHHTAAQRISTYQNLGSTPRNQPSRQRPDRRSLEPHLTRTGCRTRR